MLLCYQRPFSLSSLLGIKKLEAQKCQRIATIGLLHKSTCFKSLFCFHSHEQIMLNTSKAGHDNFHD